MSRCKICDIFIYSGKPLYWKKGYGVHKECYEKQKLVIPILNKLEEIMYDEHSVSLGLERMMGATKLTGTRAQFLDLAIEHDEIEGDDLELIRWWWHGMMNKSLFD